MSHVRSLTVDSPKSSASVQASSKTSPRPKRQHPSALSVQNRSPVSPDLPKDKQDSVDQEADDLGLNEVDIEDVFGKASVTSPSAQDLPRLLSDLHLSAAPRKIEERKSGGFEVRKEGGDRAPSFADVGDLTPTREEPGSKILTFSDEGKGRGQRLSVTSSGSKTNAGTQGKELTLLRSQKQELLQQLSEASGTITELKREIQDLKWTLEKEKAKDYNVQEEAVKMDIMRGKFLEMDRGKDLVDEENRRLRELLSCAMKEKVQLLGIKQENERLTAELSSQEQSFNEFQSAKALADELKLTKSELSTCKETLSTVHTLESGLTLAKRENEMLSAQAKTLQDLLSAARSQQENISKQVQEYSTLFLSKQQAYNDLLQVHTQLKQTLSTHPKPVSSHPSKLASTHLLQGEVRKRLSDKLNKL